MSFVAKSNEDLVIDLNKAEMERKMEKIRDKKQKGFTLVEILIVVVILAILAAMILPRIINRPETAYITEAERTMGTLRRAYISYLNLANVVSGPVIGDATVEAQMNQLNLHGLDNTTAHSWTYSCTAAGVCKAVPVGHGSVAGDTITLDLDGNYVCNGNYTYIDASNKQKGCRR
jgi:prepilin-type N-terminal cleavage/methylation domain-containing protein